MAVTSLRTSPTTAPLPRHRPLAAALVRDLVSGRTWRFTANLLLAPSLAAVAFVTTVPLLSAAAGSVLVFPVGVVLAWLLVLVTRTLGRIERYRVRTLLDADIGWPHPDDRGLRWWRRLWARLGRASTWKEIAFFVVHLPVAVMLAAATLAVWCVPLTLVALPTFAGALPSDRADLWGFTIGAGWPALAAALVGVIGLLAAPGAVRALTSLDLSLARWLLGPSRRGDLDARVAHLETSRSRVVRAAEAERRRIERDLHDGAQQRLVALAMDLGMAREKMTSDPARAQQLVIDAHGEAKQALVELRNLARGIHPAVLTDRGLDAALSAVAARSPVPVTLTIAAGVRPSTEVEGIAYFVVSEALANVAKHADASRAAVQVARRGSRLVIEISDDGHGGADPSLGTGLAGLRDRVAGVDGWLHLSSPVGGPTTLIVELPCAS